MTVKTVLRIGHPVLRRVAEPVAQFSTVELDSLITDMLDTMQAMNGAGIAAPQVGTASRVIIFGIDKNPRYPQAEPVPLTILVNPEIEVVDHTRVDGWEGCLSVPGMRGWVPRFRAIRYVGFNARGEQVERIAEDFHARVVQHELDHLDGILYPQRIADMSRFGYIEELELAGLLPKIGAAD